MIFLSEPSSAHASLETFRVPDGQQGLIAYFKMAFAQSGVSWRERVDARDWPGAGLQFSGDKTMAGVCVALVPCPTSYHFAL